MTGCVHPKRERRVRRVSMPEGVYRTEWCQRCRSEFGDVFEPRHRHGPLIRGSHGESTPACAACGESVS